jgi:hypothetical protein
MAPSITPCERDIEAMVTALDQRDRLVDQLQEQLWRELALAFAEVRLELGAARPD